MFLIFFLAISQSRPFNFIGSRVEFKLSDAYNYITTRDEIEVLFKMYGIDTTNEIFQTLRIRDKHCTEGTHLHGVLDGRNLGIACVPTCNGKIMSEPVNNKAEMNFECV